MLTFSRKGRSEVVLNLGEKVNSQILALRTEGQSNMLDVPTVQILANDHNFYELVVFLEENKEEYLNFILHGD